MVIDIRIKHNFTVILTVSLIGAGNRLIKRKPATFSRLLKSFYCISLYRVHIAMDSETYKYKEKTSNIPQVTDTLYFIRLYRVHLTMGSEKYKKER